MLLDKVVPGVLTSQDPPTRFGMPPFIVICAQDLHTNGLFVARGFSVSVSVAVLCTSLVMPPY